MRPTDIVLIILSILLVLLVGFGPLFGSHDRRQTIRQECEMFYGPNGREAVQYCMTEMAAHSVGIAR